VNHSPSGAGAPHEPRLPPYQVVLAETDWHSLRTASGNGEDLPGVLARLFALHARRVLDTSGSDPNRRVAWRALEAWGHDPPGPEPLSGEVEDRGPHSDGRGDLEPPF